MADVGTPFDDIQWAAVLRSASAFEMYRKRHGAVAADQIVEFLLLDREFPRAVHHCLINLSESLHAITGTPAGRSGRAPSTAWGRCGGVGYTTWTRCSASVCTNSSTDLQVRLNPVGDGIYETFFEIKPLQ